MGTRLYVGNLPFSTTTEELQSLFGEAGATAAVEVVQDKFTGRSRGFAFVDMADQAGADKAVQMFNGYDLGGRPLVVNEARPREERPPRSFGGGGGGGGYRGGGGGG
ncbi:RNA-binding protein, partial [Kamptonema cortianum]|nr:RNA-binding protein [Kamptonema cortianum]